MASIPIPDVPKGLCSRIAVYGSLVLSETELHELLAALDTDDRNKHGYLFRACGSDKDNAHDALNESFGLDTPEGKKLERFVEGFEQASGGGIPASYLHYRIAIECGYTVKVDENLDDSNLLASFWEWALSRAGLDSWVTAGIDFPKQDYAPLLPLPIEVPSNVANFDSVEGVSLVKWRSGTEKRSMLYEARMILRQDVINVGVRFRNRLFPEEISLDDIVARSMEIAKLAITSKKETA